MKKIIFVFLFVLLIFVISCTVSKPTEKLFPQNYSEQVEPKQEISQEQEETNEGRQPPKAFLWKDEGIAIAGRYADAEIIALDNGKYRMYYSAEPEISGFKGQVYSALSTDGQSWLQEDGVRKEWAIFPSVLKLPDGKYRMYFQNQGVLKSVISPDGLSWKDEAGIRIDTVNNAGLKLENIAAPTVIKVDGEYILVYRGTINERYSAQVPNNNIQLFFWATSKDGLVFEKKGLVLDSRNDLFQGLLDGPEFVEWDEHTVRLYFWSYRGIYYLTYHAGTFSKDAVFAYTINSNQLNPFPENPPSDPTLAKIKGRWFMYYGQHEKGIFSVVQSEVE